MTLIIPADGQLALLNKCLQETDEVLSLRLYNNNKVPRLDDVVGNYTETIFTDYERKEITGDGWDTSVNAYGVAEAVYSTTFSWTCGSTGDTVYGYYVVGADSGVLLWAEAFDEKYVMTEGDILTITPQFTLKSDV
jgi:hypothetical protein